MARGYHFFRSAASPLLLLLLLLLSPTALAVGGFAPDPPTHMVLDVYTIHEHDNSGTPAVQVDYRWTFKLPEDDPDQINGSFDYHFLKDGVHVSTFSAANGSLFPSGRTGWVIAGSNGISEAVGEGSTEFTVRAVDLSEAAPNHIGAASCAITLSKTVTRQAPSMNIYDAFLTGQAYKPENTSPTLLNSRTHYECGSSYLEPPTGLSALVLTTYAPNTCAGRVNDPTCVSATANHTTALNWRLASADPDSTNGSFDYFIYAAPDPRFLRECESAAIGGEHNATSTSGTCDLEQRMWGCSPTYEDDSVNSYITSGVCSGKSAQWNGNANGGYHVLDFGAGSTSGPQPEFFVVRARDPLTGQRSVLSCMVSVDGSIPYAGNACGTAPRPRGAVTLGDFTFPFTDIEAITAQPGYSEGFVAVFMGVGLVAGLALMGLSMAGVVGAGAGAIIGIGFAATLGVMPLYVLVVLFLAFVSIIALKMRGAPSGDS